MKELLQLLKAIPSEASEPIAIAKGKYEYTGKILKDVKKILRNG